MAGIPADSGWQALRRARDKDWDTMADGDVHVMLALNPGTSEVVVTDEGLNRTDMVGKLLRKR